MSSSSHQYNGGKYESEPKFQKKTAMTQPKRLSEVATSSDRKQGLDYQATRELKTVNLNDRPVSSTLKCARCSTSLRVDFAFCTNCGLPSKPGAGLLAREITNDVKNEHKEQSSGVFKTSNSTILPKKKKVSKNSVTSSTLSLPPALLSTLDAMLAKPVVDNKTLSKRMVQQLQAQILEMRNAEGFEIATLNKHSASLALEAPGLMSSSKYEDIKPPVHYYSVSEYNTHNKTHNNTHNTHNASIASLTVTSPTKVTAQYLDNVESISTHYRAYLNRLKQLEGLRAAMMEPPPLPSTQLNERPSSRAKVANSIADSVHVNVETHTEFTQSLQDSSLPDPILHTPVDTDTIAETDTVEKSGEGMAFMWGPIFNPAGSVADESIYSTITHRQGVRLLNAEATLGMSSRESSPSSSSRHISAGRESQRSSRASSPYRDSFFGDSNKESRLSAESSAKSQSFSQKTITPAPTSTSPPGSAEKPHTVDTLNTSAPVVMFWGNVMQDFAEDDADDGLNSPAGSSKYPSRVGSFISTTSLHSVEQQQAAEEAELPVWIETLAAETAELREEFNQEDAVIMQQVGDRLNQLDADSILLQSQRALLVQYSMDAVVKQYWERIQQMKTGMGLTTSPYKQLAYGNNSSAWPGDDNESGDVAGTPLLLMAPDGSQEEQRATNEEEEEVRAETTQETEWGVNSDDVDSTPVLTIASHSTSFYPSKVDRGTVLHKWEKQDFRDAVMREKRQSEDETMMQNLILDLVKTHMGQQELSPTSTNTAKDNTIQELSAPRPKSSQAVEILTRPQTATENRIGELLHGWEVQEENEAQQRENMQSSDDLALKHWLVAVSAIDKERATRQTLRTLQLEEMEDHEDGSDDDEDSVSSTTKRTADLQSATVIVPENHSLSIIKTLYRQSCSKMLAFLTELNVDFTIDQTENPDFRSDARTKLQFARRILKTSSNVDHKVALEYRNFLEHCSLRRTAIAMQLSEAMQQASQLEQSYRERYAEASREFKISNDAQQIPGSEATRHITSSKHMQAIKLSAELDMRTQGDAIKRLQADEAKLLLDTRQEQFVLSEVLGLWQARHSRTLHTYSLAFKRLSGLVDSTKLTVPPHDLH